MCLFIKPNFNCILFVLIAVVVVGRNWIFWVYEPSLSEYQCENKTTFELVIFRSNNSKEMRNTSKLCCESEQSICTYFCNHEFREISCRDVAANKTDFKEQQGIPVISDSICNTSQALEALCVLDRTNIKTNNLPDCKLIQNISINEIVKTLTTNVKPNFSSICNITYCFGVLSANDFSPNAVYVCKIKYARTDINLTNLRKTFDYLLLTFAIILHIITLSVFLLVPRLQAGYGKAVMSYVTAQLFRKVAVIIMMLFVFDIHEFGEVNVYGAFHFFTDLAAHSWQIIITFQIWTAFKSNVRSSGEMSPNIFIRISVIIWGGSFILIALYWILTKMFLTDPSTWMPTSVGETAFLMLLEMIPMMMSAATLLQLRASRTGTGSLKGADSKCHNSAEIQWKSLYMKIVLLAGADYVFVMTYFTLDNFLMFENNSFISDFIYYIMWDIYSFRGVEMLFIFVLKEDTWRKLRKRFDSNGIDSKQTTTTI